MLIRLQNKKVITDLGSNALSIGCTKDKTEFYVCFNTIGTSERTHCILGTYSTEEKAMKVLDTIRRFHSAMWGLKNGYLTLEDVQALMGDYFTDFDFFQMPTDEELESEEN